MAVFAAEPAVREHYGADSYAGRSAPFPFSWLPVTGLWDFKITRRSLAIVRLSWPQEIP